MENFIIRFTHRGKSYATSKRKAENEQAAIDSVVKQCELADRPKGKIIKPVIISVKRV